MFSNNVAEQHYQVNTLKVQKVGSAVGGVRNGRGKGVRKGATHKKETRGKSPVGAHTDNETGGREHKEKFHSLKMKVGSVNADAYEKWCCEMGNVV